MTVQRCLILPELLDVDQARIKDIFCVAIFDTAVFRAARLDHAPHHRAGRRKVLGWKADGSDNQ
jgi:hypothetical protein